MDRLKEDTCTCIYGFTCRYSAGKTFHLHSVNIEPRVTRRSDILISTHDKSICFHTNLPFFPSHSPHSSLFLFSFLFSFFSFFLSFPLLLIPHLPPFPHLARQSLINILLLTLLLLLILPHYSLLTSPVTILVIRLSLFLLNRNITSPSYHLLEI